ncbi:hypothetical protein MTO96_011978 [Rhipicephalus appendiculatus]
MGFHSWEPYHFHYADGECAPAQPVAAFARVEARTFSRGCRRRKGCAPTRVQHLCPGPFVDSFLFSASFDSYAACLSPHHTHNTK